MKWVVFFLTIAAISAGSVVFFNAPERYLISAVLGALYGYFYAPELLKRGS